jgi:hypothetical protein
MQSLVAPNDEHAGFILKQARYRLSRKACQFGDFSDCVRKFFVHAQLTSGTTLAKDTISRRDVSRGGFVFAICSKIVS